MDDMWRVKCAAPYPKVMVERLHGMGFKVTLWVMPFIEENSNAYREGAKLGYFVKSQARHHPLVRPARCCPPRRPTRFEPSLLHLIRSL